MGFSGRSFSIPAALPVRSGAERATLVRRTYGLVFVSVIVTMLGAAFAWTQPALMVAVGQHPFIAMLCMFAPLFMAMRAPRAYPRNIAYTLLFTFIEGIFLSPFLYLYDRTQPGIIGQAAGLTLFAFGALSLFAVFSRRDFSAWGQFFFVGLLVLFATSLLNMFFHNPTANLWISAGALVVFSGLLVFDTWHITRSGAFGEEDYVVAAVQIYLDLLNIFVAILSLLGGGRRNN